MVPLLLPRSRINSNSIVFTAGSWLKHLAKVFGNCRFSFLPSDIDTRCTWSRYSPDLDTPWQTSRHAWRCRRAWLCEQPSTVKSWKTFLLSLFHLEYYLGLHSLLGPQVAVLFLPLPPLQDRLRHCRQFAFHSHPGFSENHTDDIRIVGDDDEVKTGLQNRSGIPDVMTKATTAATFIL